MDAARPEGLTETQWAFPGPQAEHHTLNLGPSTGELVAWLTGRQPRYLVTLPSIAQEIALHADGALRNEVKLGAVIGVSELTTQITRDVVKQRLGCDLFEVYGAGEVGCVAVQSPIDHHYLVCDETTLVEIVDGHGKPVGPGELGRVIVTGLYNYATPFIRYEVGDLATRAETPCPSGRTLSRLKRIEGRRRNALVNAEGRRIGAHDVLAGEEIRRLPAARLQIVQPDIGRIELSYVATGGAGPADRAALTRYFTALIGRPVALQLAAVEDMPRSVGGKHETVISRLSS